MAEVIRVNDDFVDLIKGFAKAQGTTVAAVVRRWLEYGAREEMGDEIVDMILYDGKGVKKDG